MFDEEFEVGQEGIYEVFTSDKSDNPKEIKDFIFNSIIPEILKSVILNFDFQNDIISDIKQKAKELYNINL